jgi:hypothetical protein
VETGNIYKILVENNQSERETYVYMKNINKWISEKEGMIL